MPIFNMISGGGPQGENVYKELTITSGVRSCINKINWGSVKYKYGEGSTDYSSLDNVYGFSVSEIPENVKEIIIIQKQGTGHSDEFASVIEYYDVENKTVHTIQNANKQNNDNYLQDCAFFYLDSEKYGDHTTVRDCTLSFRPNPDFVGKYVFVFTTIDAAVYYPRVFVKC